MVDLYIEKLNEAKIRIRSEKSIAQELSEFFEFDVPGAKFMPAYKARMWDGKLRLFSLRDRTIYAGLLDHIISFANRCKYSYGVDKTLLNNEQITLEEIVNFATKLDLHSNDNKITARDYQLESVTHALNKKRIILQSPTSCLSGDTIIEAEVSD